MLTIISTGVQNKNPTSLFRIATALMEEEEESRLS
jgi:hypothetical protein